MSTLSIISYNIMMNDIHPEQRNKVIVKLLLKNSPNVICLQEVLAELVNWYIINLAPEYEPMIMHLHPKGRLYGELIFYKVGVCHPVSFQTVELPSKMGRALQHVTFYKDNVIYNVITFHLESMNCQKVRREQLKKLWIHTKDLSNVICCGDTNQTAKEVCTLPDRILDAWEQTDRTIGEYTYYSARYWDADRKQRYDKLWFSSDLKLLGFGVVGNKAIKSKDNDTVWLSDHDGLYCILAVD